MNNSLLSVKALSRTFRLKKAVLNAVSDVDLEIAPNETLALVGESGSGKTTLSRLLLLLDKATDGDIFFRGKSVSEFKQEDFKSFRRAVQPVFQNPFSSLNPRMRVKRIVAEPLLVSSGLSREQISERVSWALQATGLQTQDGEKYPHQFSGGQRQRVAIARAIVSKPELIILDEPVSSQDISIQAQILNLLKDLQQELGISYLFIAHDLATVRFMSDRVAIMYLGQIVEAGFSEQVFTAPAHPYTRALLASVLPDEPADAFESAPSLGELPSPINRPSGCCFHPRCDRASERCRKEKPVRQTLNNGRWVVCHHVEYKEAIGRD